MESVRKIAEKLLHIKQRHSRWRHVVTCIAVVVVFATTYALILPAITLEKTEQELKCPVSVHEHTKDCYDKDGNLLCGKADYVIHMHDEGCYDADGTLVCLLPEVKMHEHTNACYEQKETLVCTKQESKGHVHDKNCYTSELVCTDEGEEHVHTEACYQKTLACGMEEGEGSHAHTKDCYLTENVLTCGKQELHTHTNGCYDENGKLACGLLELTEHVHGNGCFQKVQVEDTSAAAQEETQDTSAAEQEETQDTPTAEQEETQDTPTAESEETQDTSTAEQEETQDTSAAEQEETQDTPTVEQEETQDTPAAAQAVSNDEGAGAFDEAVGVDASVQAANGAALDFKNWITGVSVQYRDQNEGTWHDLTNDSEVKSGDKLKFNIEYNVPGNSLSEEHKQITYQLPESFITVAGDSGKVLNASGQEVGTYIIDTNGAITITFYDEYVKKNQNGEVIKGNIAFESSVDGIKKGNDGNISLPFKDDLNVTIKVKDEGKTTEDLRVVKSASEVNQDNGTLTYTVTITSQNGTNDKVTLSDVMSNVKLNGSVTVTDKNGSPVSGINTPGAGATTFDLTLPTMKAGDSYTITYTAKLTNENLNGTVNANNKVSVESKDKDGKKLKDEMTVKTPFKKELLEKSGTLDESSGKIKWTVTVNKEGENIGGWTLSDALDGQAFTGNVNISPAIGGKDTITLPYKFPTGTSQTYTITYETDANQKLGDWLWNSNKVTLKTPDKEYNVDTGVNVGPYNPLSKKAESLTPNGDNTEATVKWNVTINADKGDLASGWTYTDTLQDGQWFTQAQIEAIEATLRSGLKQLTGWDGSMMTFTPAAMDGTTDKYKGFTATFNHELKKGSKIEFSYTSAAPLGDGSQVLTFKNKANINDKAWSNGEIKYEPEKSTVEKYDWDNENGGKNTTHAYTDSGEVAWGIRINLPENCTEALKVTENLPKGVTLKSIGIKAGNQTRYLSFDQTDNPSGTIWDDQANQPVSATKTDSGAVIDISEGIVAYANRFDPKTILLKVIVKINDDAEWQAADGNKLNMVLHNEATVTTKSGKDLGADGQTQTITRDQYHNLVKKSSGTVDTNIVPYSIAVNPEGNDLVVGSDSVILKDSLEMEKWCSISMSLVPDSLIVYHRNADGTKGTALNKSEYPYTYTVEDESDPMRYNLSIRLPDDQALIVEYKYKASGDVGKENWHVKNSAVLEGLAESGGADNIETHIKITESSAGANTQGATLRKVDSDNNGIGLSGAEFDLYYWDSEKNDYAIATDKDGKAKKVVTGNDGQFNMELAYNMAYKLVETKPPTGYKMDDTPYYFLIKNSDTVAHPYCKPNDFNGKMLDSGAIIYYPNTKDETQSYELPQTGGPGTTLFTFGGLAIIAGCLMVEYKMRRKRERGVL